MKIVICILTLMLSSQVFAKSKASNYDQWAKQLENSLDQQADQALARRAIKKFPKWCSKDVVMIVPSPRFHEPMILVTPDCVCRVSEYDDSKYYSGFEDVITKRKVETLVACGKRTE